jgi:hypothetical protein
MDDSSLLKFVSSSPKTTRVGRPQIKLMRKSSYKFTGDFSEIIVDICDLINCDLNDQVKVTRRLSKIFRSLTQATSVEVAFVEDSYLTFAKTNQDITRLAIDDTSLQGQVATTRISCVINNPSTSLTYANLPVKLKPCSPYTGDKVEALSVACVPIVVRPK